ncbi:hypothetical protein Tco_0119534, partial [Tanacetum coccineum]
MRPMTKDYDEIQYGSLPEAILRLVIHNMLYRINGFFYSGCSRHMTGNKSYLTNYQDIDGGFVAFAGSPKGVTAGNQTNDDVGIETNVNAVKTGQEKA